MGTGHSNQSTRSSQWSRCRCHSCGWSGLCLSKPMRLVGRRRPSYCPCLQLVSTDWPIVRSQYHRNCSMAHRLVRLSSTMEGLGDAYGNYWRDLPHLLGGGIPTELSPHWRRPPGQVTLNAGSRKISPLKSMRGCVQRVSLISKSMVVFRISSVAGAPSRFGSTEYAAPAQRTKPVGRTVAVSNSGNDELV